MLHASFGSAMDYVCGKSFCVCMCVCQYLWITDSIFNTTFSLFVCEFCVVNLHTCGCTHEFPFDTIMLARTVHTYPCSVRACLVDRECSGNVHKSGLCVFVHTDPWQLLDTTCD